MLHYTTLLILSSTFLLLNTAVGYQSISSLYSKCSLWNSFFGELSGHFRMGILLHYRNVLSILELWHGAMSCTKIYPFCGNTMHLHECLFTVITIDAIVVFGAIRMRKIMLNVFRLL